MKTQLFFPQIILLMASLVLAQVNVQQFVLPFSYPDEVPQADIVLFRKNSTSLSTSSFTPLFQPVSQTSSTVPGASGTSLMSNPTGTPLFHVVSPSATLTGHQTTTSAAATSDAITTGPKKNVAGHCHMSVTAAVAVLGMVVGLVAVS